METQTWRKTYGHGVWGRKERVGQRERVTWKHIHYMAKIDSQKEFAI